MLEAVSLGYKGVKEAVVPPRGLGGGKEGGGEWVVGGAMVVGGMVLRMYSFFSSFCECGVMDVCVGGKYTWDANKIVRGVAVNARMWVSCLAKWMTEIMEKLDEILENMAGLSNK